MEDLPDPHEPAKYGWESHRRLIAVTAAAVPAGYAAYRIDAERPAGLEKLLEWAGNDAAEVKRFRRDVESMAFWANLREAHKLHHLRRESQVTAERPWPQLIRNDKDGSLMALIADEKGNPVRFKGDKAVYIDVTETTNRQMMRFLNDAALKPGEWDEKWLARDPQFTNFREGLAPGKIGMISPEDEGRPVLGIAHPGARAFCRWSGKELPTKEEWMAGAGGKYPWGATLGDLSKNCRSGHGIPADEFSVAKAGSFSLDRSPIGCLDMAGNLAEWCADFDDSLKKRAIVCGGSFNDTEVDSFDLSSKFRAADPDACLKWVGFRGVVRLPLEK